MRDAFGEFDGNQFQHDEILAGGVERHRVMEQFARRLRGLSAATLLELVLRFEPEMTTDVEARVL